MMLTNKRFYATGPALLLTLALGASGGSSNGDNGSTPAVSAGESDSFFAQVRALKANSLDNTEPVAIDSFAVTTAKNIEPAAL